MTLDPEARQKLLTIIEGLEDAQAIAEAELTRLRQLLRSLRTFVAECDDPS
jgi:hypothetical protein